MTTKNVIDAVTFLRGGIRFYGEGDQEAWSRHACPSCGSAKMVKIAYSMNSPVEWLRCPSCLVPAVMHAGTLSPKAEPLRTVEGMPADEATLWSEVRHCLGSGANTAAVMLCRKLLFHVAVAHGLPAKKDNGWAPKFIECVKHLEGVGVVTPAMRPWVDKVKDVGNEVNHELQPVSADQALQVATFTLQLLVLAYEVQAQLTKAIGPASDTSTATGDSSADH